MRLLFFGDIVGRAGRNVLSDRLPDLIRQLGAHFVIVNGENAAGGFGINLEIAQSFFSIGVDVITTGNHIWDQRELIGEIDNEPRLLRPVNYPAGTPGKGSGLYVARDGSKIFVINAMGRLFMDQLDDPFQGVDRELERVPLGLGCDATIVDIHAEATSEKMSMGHFCDGRASLVIGTHSHIPTADAQILPGGTAYQTDAGACADYDSVIGMEKSLPVQRFLTRMPSGRLQPAQGDATLCGAMVDIGGDGIAKRIEPIRLGGRLSQTCPLD